MNRRSILRKCLNRKSSRESGAVMVFAAILFPVLIAIFAGVLYSSATPSLQNELRDLGKMICLTAIKSYTRTPCDDPVNNPTDCNTNKDIAVEDAVTHLAERHERILGDNITVAVAPNVGHIVVAAQLYYPTEPPIENPCNDDYPCIIDRPIDKIGTGMRVNGTLRTQGSPLLAFASKLFGVDDTVPVEIKAACHTVSREVVTMVDISPSASEKTHLTQTLGGVLKPSTRNSIIQAIESDKTQANRRTASNEIDPDTGESTEGKDVKSYFAYQVAETGGAFIPFPSTLIEIWDDLPKLRSGTSRTDAWFHTQDDYTGGPENAVWTYGHHRNNWESYPNKTMHPDPQSIPNTSALYASTSDLPVYYWIDGYRSGDYLGPEPLYSILQALDAFIGKFLERQVEGDKLSAIFYSDQIGWPHVVELSAESAQYIKNILRDGPDAILQPTEMLALQTRAQVATGEIAVDYTNEANVPPFYKLGWMSTNDAYTDGLMAMIEAAHQFTSAGGDVSAARAVVDFTDGIVTCGRGTTPEVMTNKTIYPNCADEPDNEKCCNRPFEVAEDQPGPSCCRSTYDIYKAADKNIDEWLTNHFFQAGITYSALHFGESGGPNWGLIDNPLIDGNQCLTDEQAREQGILLVPGMRIPNTDDGDIRGRGLFNYRLKVPFDQAAADIYGRTLITGGLYVPILPIDDRCSGVGGTPVTQPACTQGPNGTPERRRSDYRCRSNIQQMIDGLDKILEATEGYALLSADLLEQ